jgi:sRNA-binding protein
MPSTFQIERNLGSKEARQQLAVLRDKWPVAFPADAKDVRPLAISAAGEIAAAMNWSLPYTLGVLARWKMSSAYCKSVLAHEHRIGLDGSTAEPIDTKAKDLAAKQLERLAAREPAKAAEPVPMKRKSAERPPETPEQLRARIRTSLMRRKA